MLNSCLDIFEARMPTKTIGHDFGLLHALDERTAMYGWVTNTGVKLVIVVDMEGRPASSAGAGKAAVLGLKDRDLTPVSDALKIAYAILSCTDCQILSRHSRHCRQHTFASCATRSTRLTTTTHVVLRERRHFKSPVPNSSKKSRESGMPGIPATWPFDDGQPFM